MLDRRNHFEISSVVVELYAKMYEKMPKILRNEKRHKLETKNIWFKIWCSKFKAGYQIVTKFQIFIFWTDTEITRQKASLTARLITNIEYMVRN